MQKGVVSWVDLPTCLPREGGGGLGLPLSRPQRCAKIALVVRRPEHQLCGKGAEVAAV